MDKKTLYDVLQVSRNADPETIKAAYKSLVQRYHPDKNPDSPDAESNIKEINRAHEILSDPVKRAEYDATLAEEGYTATYRTEPAPKQETERGQEEKTKHGSNADDKAQNSNGKFFEKYTIKKLLSTLSLIAVLIAAVIGGGIGKMIGKAAMTPAIPSPEQIEEKLIEGFTTAARQYNTKLPMMVDNDTRLDSVTVGPGPRVNYHYTFPNYTSKDIEPNWLRENLLPEVKNKVCASKDMRLSLELGGIYVFSYAGSDGIGMDKFEFDRNDCGIASKYPLKQSTPSSSYQTSQETNRDTYRQIPEATILKDNGQNAAREVVAPNIRWDNERYGVTTEKRNNISTRENLERQERLRMGEYERLERVADQEKAARMEMTAKLENERLGKERLGKEKMENERLESERLEKERLKNNAEWLEKEKENYRNRAF